jgi:hypothetical protein
VTTSKIHRCPCGTDLDSGEDRYCSAACRKASTSGGVTFTVELVTPQIAKEWLDVNGANRNIRERLVNAYARDMLSGRWQMAGEPVKFSGSVPPRLLDGQHRLHAVVKSGMDVLLPIVRGLAEDTQQVMDSGAGRTAADALRMRGEVNYANLAATARLAIAYQRGQFSGPAEKATHTEIAEFIVLNPDLRDAIELSVTWRNGIDMPMSVLGLAVWRTLRIDRECCIAFFTQLAERTNFVQGSAILALHNRLTEVRRNRRLLDRADYLSLTFRAWNYWRTGKQTKNLPITTHGGVAVDVPEPR